MSDKTHLKMTKPGSLVDPHGPYFFLFNEPAPMQITPTIQEWLRAGALVFCDEDGNE